MSDHPQIYPVYYTKATHACGFIWNHGLGEIETDQSDFLYYIYDVEIYLKNIYLEYVAIDFK